jgi:predicted nucleic acid-binding Zn ribbon protein
MRRERTNRHGDFRLLESGSIRGRNGSGSLSRRRAPRPAGDAFRAARDRAAPQTGLAAVQAAWSSALGERLATAAQPVSERDGTVTVDCVDGVWAQELDLMQATLLERLQGVLGERAPEALRFRVKKDPS